MQIVILFLASLAIAAYAKALAQHKAPSAVDLVIGTTATAMTAGLSFFTSAAGDEWSLGILLFLVAALTLGLHPLTRRSLFGK